VVAEALVVVSGPVVVRAHDAEPGVDENLLPGRRFARSTKTCKEVNPTSGIDLACSMVSAFAGWSVLGFVGSSQCLRPGNSRANHPLPPVSQSAMSATTAGSTCCGAS
jgi:hypothetical protein